MKLALACATSAHLSPILIPLWVILATSAPAAPSVKTDPARTGTALEQSQEAAEIAKEFASWKLRNVTGIAAAKEVALIEALSARAAKSLAASPKDADLSVLVTETHAAWIVAIDTVKPKVAARDIRSLMFSAAAPYGDRTGPAAEAIAAAFGDPRVDRIIRRRSLHPFGDRLSESAPVTVLLDRRIEDAVVRGDDKLVTDLGLRAVPTLKRLALHIDGTRGAKETSLDPLNFLLRASAPDGFEVASELFAKNDILIRRHVAQSLKSASPFDNPDNWTKRAGRGDLLKRPSWDNILVQIAADAGLGFGWVAPHLRPLVARGWAPSHLIPLIEKHWNKSNPKNLEAYPDLKGLARSLMQSEVDNLRITAVRYFSRTADTASLFEMVNDSHPRVLGGVGYALQSLQANAYDADRGDWTTVTVLPTIDNAYRDALRTLWNTEIDPVGIQALSSAESLGRSHPDRTLSIEFLLELVHRADEAKYLQGLIDYSSVLKPAEVQTLYTSILDTLAQGEMDPTKRANLCNVVLTSAANSEYIADPWALLDVATEKGVITEINLRDATFAFSRNAQRAPQHADRFLDWATEHADVDAWRFVISELRESVDESVHVAGRFRRFAEQLTGPQYLKLLSSLGTIPGIDLRKVVQERLVASASDEIEALIFRPSTTRTCVEYLLEILKRRGYRSTNVAPLEKQLTNLFHASYLEAEDAKRMAAIGLKPQRVLKKLLDKGKRNPKAIDTFDFPITDEATLESVLAYAPPETWRTLAAPYLKRSIIAGVTESKYPGRIKFLEIVTVRDPSLWSTIAKQVRDNPRPGDLAFIGEFFLFEEVPTGDTWRYLLEATTSYLNDEAGEILLEAAKRPLNTEQRADVMASLDTILNWQEASAKWKRNQTAAARRLKAIDDLIALIDGATASEEAKAEAVRGLGLLDAADELPRLIGLLQDGSEPIRKAAREAIDRLNAQSGD